MSAPDCEGGGVQDHAVQDGGALPMHLCVYQNFGVYQNLDLFIKILMCYQTFNSSLSMFCLFYRFFDKNYQKRD